MNVRMSAPSGTPHRKRMRLKSMDCVCVSVPSMSNTTRRGRTVRRRCSRRHNRQCQQHTLQKDECNEVRKERTRTGHGELHTNMGLRLCADAAVFITVDGWRVAVGSHGSECRRAGIIICVTLPKAAKALGRSEG